MSYLVQDEELQKIRNKRFVRRVFLLRQFGVILCFIPFFSVIKDMGYGPIVWLLLAANALIWPIAAYFLSIHSKDAIKTEQYSLVADTFLGGCWVAIMGLNPFPSLVLVSIFIADRYAAGGWRLLRTSILAFFGGFFLFWFMLGFPINFAITEKIMWLTLPLATLYVIALSIVSRNLSTHLSNKLKKMERIALMDPRLHIPNRRLFEQRLVNTFIQTQRGKYNAFLMLLDVDNFKAVNDTYGHETGDYVLLEISNILKNIVHPEDIPARYGGDELALIIFEYDELQARDLAQQICLKVQQLTIPNAPNFKISISIGVASAKHCESTLQWLEEADRALYRVKRLGRNGVHFAASVS
ncbi:diguanylate cyclase [Acinetobacter sp. MD2(2019)]|uniref:diguanylate cyclase n=1 Tax=Acinetobacter sp. MD2(2019) TaxID=2605273 RepID=UPI002D1EB779|nr:diguanylate cyclase [Acinetobacter sp. MD2(2019)]MEB3754777.1 diguanylate cyclase [Acinetobacter sp. MD2(2019)]